MVGRWGTKGDALSLYRLDGTLVASIKQISFTFGTRFEIYKDFEKVGTLQKFSTGLGILLYPTAPLGCPWGYLQSSVCDPSFQQEDHGNG